MIMMMSLKRGPEGRDYDGGDVEMSTLAVLSDSWVLTVVDGIKWLASKVQYQVKYQVILIITVKIGCGGA